MGHVAARPAGFVYFIEQPSTGLIKIGHSRSPKDRLVALKSAFAAADLSILALYIGSTEDERAEHRRWAHCRVHREWFRATPELLARIAEIGPLPPAFVNSAVKACPVLDDATKSAEAWVRYLEDREASRSNITVAEARRVVAARGVYEGTLGAIRKRRLKSVTAADYFKLKELFIEEKERELSELRLMLAQVIDAGGPTPELTIAEADLASASDNLARSRKGLRHIGAWSSQERLREALGLDVAAPAQEGEGS